MSLYKGIFWITDSERDKYIFRIPCDVYGNVTGQAEFPLNSKDGTNYNHKLLWSTLPKTSTGGKPFDYFPRGRVEIKSTKATVYLNPDINCDELQNFIIDRFGLKAEKGIKSVRFVSDGSDHYKYQS